MMKYFLFICLSFQTGNQLQRMVQSFFSIKLWKPAIFFQMGSEDEDDWDWEWEEGKPEHWSLDWSAVVKQRCIIFGYLPEFRKRFISTGLLPYDILCGANLDGGAGVLAGAQGAPKWLVAALSTSGNTQSVSGHWAARWSQSCHAEDSYRHLD